MAHSSSLSPPPSRRCSSDQALSDEALMARIAMSEEGALAELARRYVEECKAVAVRVLREPSDAEAVAWRVLEDVWENRGRWLIRSPRSFLLSRSRSLALTRLRTRTAADRRHREWARQMRRGPPPGGCGSPEGGDPVQGDGGDREVATAAQGSLPSPRGRGKDLPRGRQGDGHVPEDRRAPGPGRHRDSPRLVAAAREEVARAGCG